MLLDNPNFKFNPPLVEDADGTLVMDAKAQIEANIRHQVEWKRNYRKSCRVGRICTRFGRFKLRVQWRGNYRRWECGEHSAYKPGRHRHWYLHLGWLTLDLMEDSDRIGWATSYFSIDSWPQNNAWTNVRPARGGRPAGADPYTSPGVK